MMYRSVRMAVSPLNMEQRRAALEKSVSVWRKRAGGRNVPKTARMPLAEMLASDSEKIRNMRVSALVASLPGIGKKRAQRILAELSISGTRCIQGLGSHERERLLARCTPPHRLAPHTNRSPRS
jgi:hypothetical protein